MGGINSFKIKNNIVDNNILEILNHWRALKVEWAYNVYFMFYVYYITCSSRYNTCKISRKYYIIVITNKYLYKTDSRYNNVLYEMRLYTIQI